MRTAVIGALLGCVAAFAQVPIDPAALPPALRETQPVAGERPLKCEVVPIKPLLDFSLRYQSGYVARLPMKLFFGPGHRWLIRIRVTPDGGDRRPVFLGSRMRLPDIPRTNAWFEVGGGFWVGEGTYTVDWALADEAGRVCRKSWRIEVKPGGSDRTVTAAIQPNTVAALFRHRVTGAAARGEDLRPIRLTVLLHAAPLNPRRTRLRPGDRAMLLSSLAALLEQLPVRSVRLILFNLDQQKELFRQDVLTTQGLGDAVQSLNTLELGVVDYRTLGNRGGHIDLLADLVSGELRARPPSELVIFLGPSSRYSDKLPPEVLAKPAGPAARFLYFRFQPYAGPTFPDSVDSAVKRLGGKTVIIRWPHDLAKAVAQVKRQLAGGE